MFTIYVSLHTLSSETLSEESDEFFWKFRTTNSFVRQSFAQKYDHNLSKWLFSLLDTLVLQLKALLLLLGKIFRQAKMTKFLFSDENFARRIVLPDENFAQQRFIPINLPCLLVYWSVRGPSVFQYPQEWHNFLVNCFIKFGVNRVKKVTWLEIWENILMRGLSVINRCFFLLVLIFDRMNIRK